MPLQHGHYYHIFNRGNNGETIFREERNYHYFLDRYKDYIYPIADTFAYCLLPNHFHLLVKIRDLPGLKPPSKHFSNLFNAYTKAVNKTYQRTGSLFEKPFHRKEVTSQEYLRKLVLYIHFNPQKHGLIGDFRSWPYSSYEAMIDNQPTRICRDETLRWFGGLDGFVSAHAQYKLERIEEGFD